MNAEIEKQIASIIEAAKSTGTDAVDFIKKQSPDYFAQLIKWYVWDGALDIIKGIGWLVASIICAEMILPPVYHWWQATDKDQPAILGFLLTVAILVGVGICSVCSVTGGITQIIKAKIAPKVIIMDAIKSALKRDTDEDDD